MWEYCWDARWTIFFCSLFFFLTAQASRQVLHPPPPRSRECAVRLPMTGYQGWGNGWQQLQHPHPPTPPLLAC
jgi:hypothetical protein